MTNQPCSLTVEHYDTKIKIEKDHSDVTLHEMFDMFKTACLGMTYPIDLYNEVICELANEIQDEDIKIRNEKITESFF